MGHEHESWFYDDDNPYGSSFDAQHNIYPVNTHLTYGEPNHNNVHPELSGFVDNALYISPEVIHADLKRIYKSKTIDLNDVIEWCAEVETLHVPEVDRMFNFEVMEHRLDHGLVLLPCNMFRLLDVYTDPSTSDSILDKVKSNGQYLYGFPHHMLNGTKIYLNYVGIPVTSEGMPLVMRTHRSAIGFYIRLRIFEEEMNMGTFPISVWQMYDRKFSDACSAAKQDLSNYQRHDYNDLVKIRGAVINRLGHTTLQQNLFKSMYNHRSAYGSH